MSMLLSRRDMDFILFEWLRIDHLLQNPLYSEHDKETVQATIDLAETIANDHFQPANRIADQTEPELMLGGEVVLPDEIVAALTVFTGSGLLAASQTVDRGGMQLPVVVDRAAFAWFQAASPAISGYALLSVAAANLLFEHGDDDQIAKYADPLLAG